MSGALQAGTRAPEFELGDPDGRRHRPLERGEGARGDVLLAFFKDDCPTSRYTLPFLGRIHRALAGRGVRMFGVSQDGSETARACAGAAGIEFPVLLDDGDYRVSRAYGLTTVPSLFLIGGEGRVRRALAGFHRKEIEAFARDLAEGLGAPPPEVFLEGEQVAESRPG